MCNEGHYGASCRLVGERGHNADPRSPKRDYKLNDVLGAVLISIPMPE